MKTGRRLLVTGATGGLGRRLLPGLATMGWAEIRLLTHRRPAPAAPEPVFTEVRGSLEDLAALERASAGIDAMLHLAAVTHSHDAAAYERVNRWGTERLLQASRAAGTERFVFMSSRAAGPTGGAYARSKWDAENAVRAAAGAAFHALVLCPAEVYGPGSNDAVETLIGWVRRWGFAPVVGADDTRLAPVHVDDLVPAILASLESEARGAARYVLAGPQEVTPRELVQLAGESVQARAVALPVPDGAVRAAARLCRWLGSRAVVADQLERLRAPKPSSSEEARRDLGFAPRGLREGLRDGLARIADRG